MPRKSPDGQFLLLITSQCGQNCPDCIYERILGNKNLPLKTIETEILPHLTRDHHVFVTGGEPTLHPRFWKIVELIAGRKPRFVQVITNGLSFSHTKGQAKAFADRIDSIAQRTRTPVAVRVSINDALASTLKGGQAEIKHRVGLIKDAFEGKQGAGLWFFAASMRGQTEEGLIKKYGLPKQRTAFGTWQSGKHKDLGTMERVLISPTGKVFARQKDMLLGERQLGKLGKEKLPKILRRRNMF